MKRRTAILAHFGIEIPKTAHILDFGCGVGRTVYSLYDQGYINTVGYDTEDHLDLRTPDDRLRFFIATPEKGAQLPFENNTFDLILSEQVMEHVMDQVGYLRELHRVMKPGGCAIHVFPARYSLLEQHIYVPFGGVFAHRWWYKLWALAGIRNEYQKDCSSDEVADRNAFYFVSSLNYVPNSCYKVVWQQLGYEYRWIDRENWLTSHRTLVRMVGWIDQFFPVFGWLSRTFHTRRCLLIKRQ